MVFSSTTFLSFFLPIVLLLLIPASLLPAGAHMLAVRVIAADGQHYSESMFGRVVVGP
ncbi:MAG TPA: hypothetical protein VF146_14375 [Bryobacteraceae bacterium]